MNRDYISYELQRASKQIEELNQRERDKVEAARKNLLTTLSPTVAYEFLAATSKVNTPATNFRTTWQRENYSVNDCLSRHIKTWQKGSHYYKALFESPKIHVAALPPYSFFIQFTFTLAQPYISRDEQDFYIIDNPVRKDKIFGLPYVASTSWKGSLRAAFWHLEDKDGNKGNATRHLFGNEKATDASNDFQAGYLYFYPTFFTSKGLEIINRQDRKKRAGMDPILFESVPAGTTGIFTLLYIPFDLMGNDEQETRKQVGRELHIVADGLKAMFRTHGFGAKTNSGFGLARETLQNVLLEIRTPEKQKPSEPIIGFAGLVDHAEKVQQTLMGIPKEVKDGQ